MKIPTNAFLALLFVSTVHAEWLDYINSAMGQVGVNMADVKTYTDNALAYKDKLNGAMSSVQGTISNVVDKVDWKALYKISTEKIKPHLQKTLPPSVCGQNIKIKSFSTEVHLFDAKVRKIKEFSSTAKVVNETETSINVEFRLEYEDLRLKYNFTYRNLLLEDIYTVKKQGRLLLIQKPTAYVSIYGSVPKLNSGLSDLKKKGLCIIQLQNVNATLSGNLVSYRIEYKSSGLGYTERTISGIIDRAKTAIQKHSANALASAMETEVRKMKIFCQPERSQETYDCTVTNNKKLA